MYLGPKELGIVEGRRGPWQYIQSDAYFLHHSTFDASDHERLRPWLPFLASKDGFSRVSLQ